MIRRRVREGSPSATGTRGARPAPAATGEGTPDGWHLPDPGFSLYDFVMAGDDEASDEQIQTWAEEAEAGYDVEELKRRGRGRPGRGAEPTQVIAVRLTAEEIAALDAYAAREHLSRSEAIRRALAGYAA